MLKAMLRGKLRRDSGDENGSPEPSAWDRFTALEDPLTAAIFARFTYLDSSLAWDLLRSACITVPGDEHIPPVPPAEPPRAGFWPRLSPGEGSFHSKHIEPDVLIEWGRHVLLVEAKHHDVQHEDQWVNQIRAVRADARFAERPLVFVAAGGIDAGGFGLLVAAVRTKLHEDRITFLLLSWNALHETAVTRRTALAGAAAAIVDDIVAALAAWGYRHRVGFDSLPEAASPFSLALDPKALEHWRVR